MTMMATISNHEKQDNWFSPPNETFPYNAVYHKLDKKSHEIRLILLVAGTNEEKISCQIQTHISLNQPRLDEVLQYEAVSYCAGNPYDNVPILLNGHTFRVFRSLFLALQRFRLPSRNRLLWIDQICIDQTNIRERDFQVLLMKKIYESASGTLVWLGETTPPMDKGLDLIQAFVSANRQALRDRIMHFRNYSAEYLQSSRKRLKIFPDEVADYLESERIWNASVDPVLLEFNDTRFNDAALLHASSWILSRLETDPEGWNGVLMLIQQRYWTRCWIYQEIVVSAHINVYCGGRAVLWEDLILLLRVFPSAAVLHMQKSTNAILQEASSNPSPRIILKAFFSTYGAEYLIPCLLTADARRDGNWHNLSKHLAATRMNLASDPRDKIYSLVALADDGIFDYITPDYSTLNTKEDTFVAATKAVILHEGSWAILAEASGREIEVGLPSWAPDWTSQDRGTDLSPDDFPFCAGGSRMELPEFLENNRVLKASAFVLGTIDALGHADSEEDGTEVVQSWKDIFLKRYQTPGMSHCNAFLRTLDMSTRKPESFTTSEQDLQTFMDAWSSAISEYAVSQPAERGSHGRRFAIVRSAYNEYLAMSPSQARIGDVICIFKGSIAPMVIRPTGPCGLSQENSYQFVGESYVDSVMYGEILEIYETGGVDLRTVLLV